MKLLLLLVASVSLVSSTEWLAGRKLRASRSSYEVRTDPSVCATSATGTKYCTYTPGCYDNSYFQCYQGSALYPKNCPYSAPYCSGGACVAQPPLTCNANFQCPGEGYFPKYNDCLTYYYCSFDPLRGDFVAVQNRCNAGYPFNPSGPQDRKCQSNGTCVTAQCSGATDGWKPLNYENITLDQTALFCSGGRPVYIDSCPSGLSIDLTRTDTKKCYVQCVADYQVAAFESDNRFYYVCRGGTAWLHLCESGQVFDGKSCTAFSTTRAPAPTPAPAQP